jgi:hypothetical protein
MCEDLRNSSFSSDSELPTIIDQYEKSLEETLQKHAPLNEELLLPGHHDQPHGITKKLVKPKDTVEDTSVGGEHLDCALTKRYILNN